MSVNGVIDLGDRKEDATVDFAFTSFSAVDVPTVLAGSPVLSVYKANSDTQSVAGITLGVDHDSLVGLNHVRLDLSSDAFYAIANDYLVVITTGTIDSVSAAGTVVATFSIENRFTGGSIAVGAGGIAQIAESATVTTGTETLTYTATEELDGTTHDVAADGNNTDFYYQFDVGLDGIATEFLWFGYAQSNNDSYAVFGYDWVSEGFKQIGTIAGGNGSAISEQVFVPAVNMTGTGANAGKVRLQFTSADGTEIFTDRVLCEFTQAVTGIANGSTVTLSAATTNTNLIGKEWILALGGQNITGSFISGATVTGTATATAEYEFEECDMGAVTLDNDGHFERCALEGTFTVGQAGTFTFHQCFNESTAAITIDFGALGATAVHLLDFHGLVNLKNMAAGDTVHITGGGNITTETCTAGAIDYDGFFEYTDSGGNVTAQQSDIQVAVDGTLARTLTAAPLAQLSQNLDNCLTGTASSTPTTTTMVSNIAVTVDDQYKTRIITFDDDTTTAALRKQTTDITGCTAASNLLTFTELTTAPVSGDTFVIT